jgi:hypothetical protein
MAQLAKDCALLEKHYATPPQQLARVQGKGGVYCWQ